MNDEELNKKLPHFKSAVEFVAGKVAEGKNSGDTGYPLNRGDIMILVMLIDRELPIAPSDWMEPLNGKRLTAIREKLGNLAFKAPQMSGPEAQQFRE